METLYGQPATHLALSIFLRKDHVAEGGPVVELCERFMSGLLVPPYKPVNLTTIRSGASTRDNSGPFNERRWKDTQKKLLSGDYSFVFIDGKVHENEKPSPWFLASFNNKAGGDLSFGLVTVSFTLPYARQAPPSWVEDLLSFGAAAWKGLGGAYGYANIAYSPPRGGAGRLPWELEEPPERRAHAVPVAFSAADNELKGLYASGKGIKGAFWANFLDADRVKALGGEARLGTLLPGFLIQPLEGGLLIVATEHPLPPDTQECRERFLALHRALQPAFLEKSKVPEHRKPLLSYFFRERESIVP